MARDVDAAEVKGTRPFARTRSRGTTLRRFAALVAVAASLTLGLAHEPARSQQLVPLHIRNFAISLDRTTVHVGEVFHLIVHTHVDEVLTQLDQTTLPSLYGFESQGDERVCSGSTKGGTDCTETLALVPQIAGDRTIGPVTLDAIDANTGRPSRFGTNVVTIRVTPDPLAVVGPAFSGAVDVIALVARVLILVALIVLLAVALRWLFARSRRPASDMFEPRTLPANPLSPFPQQPAAAPISAPFLDPFDARFRAALERLRAEPMRANALALRALVRERCGAGERETLGDLLARNAARGDAALVEALRALDRAAFVEDANVVEAIVAAYPALERLAAAPA
jgi:hypothetical protein